ncbi:MAG: DNA polymerase III subunit delta [Streptococcus pyogenes]|nr:MAG: DNA polymerase III subunit delta [Streptococcus pyogenes]
MIALEVLQKLTVDQLGPLTLVTGDDVGQYTELRDTLLSKIGYDKDDLTYSFFDLSNTSYKEAEMDLVSLPFFADYKFVIFDQLLDITTAKKAYFKEQELKAFEAYLEKPLESTRLIILAPGKLDGKRRLVKLLKRDARVFEATPLKEQEFKRFFQAYGDRLGLSFDSGVFDRLLVKSNGDFGQMVKNLTFLKDYKPDDSITLDDIEEAIPKTLQDNVFQLIKHLLRKNASKASSLVHDLRLQGEDEIKLIAILLGQFRLYLQLAILQESGKNEQQMLAHLSTVMGRKLNPYQIKYALADTRSLSIAYLKTAVGQLIETDYQIKTGVNDKAYLFDICLLKLMASPL